MGTQQYHAGETIEAMFDFLYGGRLKSVTAIFAHLEDPTTKLRISSMPEEQRATQGAGYGYWQVTLTGEYPYGRKVPFAGVLDVGIEVAEEEIPPPEVVGDWEWRREA